MRKKIRQVIKAENLDTKIIPLFDFTGQVSLQDWVEILNLPHSNALVPSLGLLTTYSAKAFFIL